MIFFIYSYLLNLNFSYFIFYIISYIIIIISLLFFLLSYLSLSHTTPYLSSIFSLFFPSRDSCPPTNPTPTPPLSLLYLFTFFFLFFSHFFGAAALPLLPPHCRTDDTPHTARPSLPPLFSHSFCSHFYSSFFHFILFLFPKNLSLLTAVVRTTGQSLPRSHCRPAISFLLSLSHFILFDFPFPLFFFSFFLPSTPATGRRPIIPATHRFFF